MNHVVVLDPQFAVYCDNLANTNVTPFAEERDLLGWFTDNEINFNQDQLRNLVKDLPAGDPSREAALAWAAEKGLSESDCINYTAKVTEAIKKEFAAYLADHYFKTVSAAIRKYDQNHLILGSRLHGRPRAIEGVVAASHQYMDVTSVNFYDRWSPNEQIAASSWTADKPCLVGEFYIKDINVQNKSQSGAGWYVNSQANRGKFYQNSCLELLQNKNYIGWHYFRFKDDDDGSNKGIVSNALIEYTEMTQYMEELNKQVYSIIDFLDGVNRRPDFPTTRTYTINSHADTWVIPGASNTQNFGNDAELEIRYHVIEANRREAFLKFDLSDLKSKLPYLKHAELIVTCTQSDDADRAIFASGISDVSWEEFTLTGELRQNNTDWKAGYNRLSFLKGKTLAGQLVFDVTPWLFDNPNEAIASFKIHDLNSTNTAIKIASREYEDETFRPILKLTFWDDSTGITSSDNSSGRVILTPNPVRDKLTIHGDDFMKAEIYTLNGQFLLSSTVNHINVSDISSGIYVVRVFQSSGKSSFYKLNIIG